jgi:hypothetical protein
MEVRGRLEARGGVKADKIRIKVHAKRRGGVLKTWLTYSKGAKSLSGKFVARMACPKEPCDESLLAVEVHLAELHCRPFTNVDAPFSLSGDAQKVRQRGSRERQGLSLPFGSRNLESLWCLCLCKSLELRGVSVPMMSALTFSFCRSEAEPVEGSGSGSFPKDLRPLSDIIGTHPCNPLRAIKVD